MRFRFSFFCPHTFPVFTKQFNTDKNKFEIFYQFSLYFLLFEDEKDDVDSLTIWKCFIRYFLEKEELERPVLNSNVAFLLKNLLIKLVEKKGFFALSLVWHNDYSC